MDYLPVESDFKSLRFLHEFLFSIISSMSGSLNGSSTAFVTVNAASRANPGAVKYQAGSSS